MGSDRRTFIKTAIVGAASIALGNPLVKGHRNRSIDKLYDGAMVIDSLSVGRQWGGGVAYSIVKDSGYTGIQTSLHSRTWDGALKDIAEWNDRISENPDLSHCGKQTLFDGIQFSDPPACFTHTMCESIYRNHLRAKTDNQIRTMADKDGVMGVAALGYFVGPDPGGKTTIETYLDHVDHRVKVGGIDHVALCTDFPIQGIKAWATKETWYKPRHKLFKPSYKVKWPLWIPDLDKPGRFRSVAHGLNKRGYSDDNIEKILGLNWLSYFDTVLRS